MSDSPPNLFNALFEFHPREGHTPKENFLSEAFAHVLRTSDEARDAWLSLAMGEAVKSQQFELATRLTERDEESVAIFPDMKVSGIMDGGRPFGIYSEHKWNSPCNPGQIRKYLRAASQNGEHCRLVFVGSSYRQKKEAEASDSRMKGKTFLWADVFQALDQIKSKPDLLVQFLDFMKTHGLSPGQPIESATMVGFIQSKGFLGTLEHFANKLNDDFDWDFLPKRYRAAESRPITNRWGRTAIEFATPDWKPTITIGFLHDEWDHGVHFVNRHKGIDLLLRIETSPSEQKNIRLALPELERKKKALLGHAASALMLKEQGNDNNHSLLIVRSCLADVAEQAASQQEQLEKIYQTLKGWCQVLFSDGSLEKAFKQAGLDSGF